MLRLLNRWGWLTLLSIGLACVAWSQSAGQPPSGEQPLPTRFSQVMERFARQRQVNVLADYSTQDEIRGLSGPFILPDAPTLEDIARTYGREVLRVGSTVVLRSFSISGYDYFRYGEERKLIIFADLIWRGKQLEVQAKKNDDGTMKVTVRASGVSLKEFCERFGQETGWKLEVDPMLHNIRIFARWRSTPPGEIVEAVSALVQTGVEAKLWLSEAQKGALQQAKEQLLEQEPAARRGMLSDELLQHLLPLLTPEEMERYKRGERVEMHHTRLPEDILVRALQYVEEQLLLLEKLSPGNNLSPVRGRLREVEFILNLPSADLEKFIFSPTMGISLKHPDTGLWNHF